MQKQMHDALKIEHWMLKQTLEQTLEKQRLQIEPEVDVSLPDEPERTGRNASEDARVPIGEYASLQVRYSLLEQMHDALKSDYCRLEQVVTQYESRHDASGIEQSVGSSSARELYEDLAKQHAALTEGSIFHRDWTAIESKARPCGPGGAEKLDLQRTVAARLPIREPRALSQTYSMLAHENETLKQAHAALEVADRAVKAARKRSASPTLPGGESLPTRCLSGCLVSTRNTSPRGSPTVPHTFHSTNFIGRSTSVSTNASASASASANVPPRSVRIGPFTTRSTSPPTACTDATVQQSSRSIVLPRSSMLPFSNTGSTGRSIPPSQYVVHRQLSGAEEDKTRLQRMQASPFQEDKMAQAPHSRSRIRRCLSLLDSATRHLPSAALPQ